MTNIYQVNDCDWVAAESLAAAAEFYVGYCGEEIDHDEAYELSDEELDTKRFIDEGEYGPERQEYTFREALALMLAAGEESPFFFASTEQ
jgi:hypothetical protein